jgi:hypothetical protein
MKEGIHSIEALAAEITRRSKAKQDLLASTNNLEVVVNADNTQVALAVKGKAEPFPINAIAHRQIGSHLKIPADYYDRMLQNDPALLAKNINSWLWKNRENRLIRTLFGTTRAFLSDSYRPLENEDLAEAVLPALINADADVMSAQITERALYIKAVDRSLTRELAKTGNKFGDNQHKIVRVACPAVTVRNSEVGFHALSIQGGVFDGGCSNLATFGERSTRKYHVGAKHELAGEETYALLSDETRRVTDEALWRQVGDIVKAAFDRARFDQLCDKIDASREDRIESDDIVQTISFATKKLGMSEDEGKSVFTRLVEDGDGLNRFGFYNAVTRASADLEDYDRASEFERLGGKIIEMPKTEWAALING